MPAAIAVPAIIGAVGAGAQLAGAKMASNTAQRAAAIQTASVDKAQQFNQQAYNDQKAALAPYLNFGQQSLADLQTRYGNGQSLQNRFAPTGMTNTGHTSYAQPQQLAPNASGMTLADMQQRQQQGQSQGQPPMAQALTAPQGGNAFGGGTVKLRAPDGEVRDVPAAMAQALMARGAQRVA